MVPFLLLLMNFFQVLNGEHRVHGEEYLLEEVASEAALSTKGEVFSLDVLYWMGYLYRYWHYYTGESSAQIYRQAPVKTMKRNYLMFFSGPLHPVIICCQSNGAKKLPARRRGASMYQVSLTGSNYLPSATSLMDLDRRATASSQSTSRMTRGGTIRMMLEPIAVTRKWFLMQ